MEPVGRSGLHSWFLTAERELGLWFLNGAHGAVPPGVCVCLGPSRGMHCLLGAEKVQVRGSRAGGGGWECQEVGFHAALGGNPGGASGVTAERGLAGPERRRPPPQEAGLPFLPPGAARNGEARSGTPPPHGAAGEGGTREREELLQVAVPGPGIHPVA